MAGLLFRQSAGIDIVQVPYKGNAPALTDLLGGQVTMMFDTINTSIGFAKAGRLRALAVTSTKRSSLAPELPTVAEAALPGFDVRAWFAILVPARTPREIVRTLNVEINKALSDQNIRTRPFERRHRAGGRNARAYRCIHPHRDGAVAEDNKSGVSDRVDLAAQSKRSEVNDTGRRRPGAMD
jgi:tripartite-type tricarboxylate transporter receptor subunit TctC